MKRSRKNKREALNPLAALMPLPAEKIRADMDRNLSALYALEHRQHTTDEEWIDLSDCVNVVEMLIEMGEIDQEHASTSQAAIGAMVDCKDRHVAGHGLYMTADEARAMHQVLALYHACLERKPWMIIYKAQKTCTERIARIKAEKAAANKAL